MGKFWCWLDAKTNCRINFICSRHNCKPVVWCPKADPVEEYFKLKEQTFK